ncbi:hypothetical protein [Acutalibacter sp. 1XD8-36]|uniref:hypothetical protein n=1 Tax=Acutalibacter sp. 1XD8-36 TaxID=2320852 RepID=UPI00261C0BDB|nr:hypothetical protein [Acutalibacter sp. 1XD8-36]
MDSVENMRKILNGSGAYRLDGGTIIDQELEAYGAGLRPVEESLARLEGDIFAATAGPERLGIWERFYRRQSSWADIDTRRRGAAAALSRRGGPVLMRDMEGILDAAGIRGSAGLEEGKMVIHVKEYLGITEAEARKVVGRMMPAGVRWEIRAG